MSKDPENISDILGQFIKENHLEKGIDNVRVNEVWEQVMGKGIVNYTQSVQLRNHNLYVSLSSAVVREELSYGKSKIIEMLNEALGKDIIKKVILK
jgi:hypothetical protein